ncbi:RibD family protein [Pontivivens insulae]|uniref:Riboflavin biosynthesis protein RibD n=1 Tax=Pontivivens insulae TaxID=1639689 RepID=A0A2R8AF56_9RHOB|nr:RibD family protein [Pontivivens insulae]RED12106.1 riboflavin-specific deaminase-like protein [Pontivivens insulae]SPF30862.1 Riboflavin biosynthesis protein RibD [Pontivivens insulae]
MNATPQRTLAPLVPERFRDGPVVIAQLGQTLDGRIATVTGASKYINGTSALDHLHRLRAEVDAVLVGVGTAIADDPQLTVRRVDGAHPVRVVVDPNGRSPQHLTMFSDGEAPVLVITKPGVRTPEGVEHLEIAPDPSGTLPPSAIIAALAARGLNRVLVEGGADTLARFIDADSVDLLHILMAPMILGSGKSGLLLNPVERLDEARRPETRVHVFEDGDVLFTCDLRRNWERS